MKFVTSFGFRAGLVSASHLIALVLFIANGEWLALVWLVVASLWAAVAFMFEYQAGIMEKNANCWRDLYEKSAGRVS